MSATAPVSAMVNDEDLPRDWRRGKPFPFRQEVVSPDPWLAFNG